MPETTYTYTVSTAMPGGKVNTSRLVDEIRASSIVTALDRIDTSGGTLASGVLTGGTLNIVFKDALSAGDKTTLDNDTNAPAGGLLAAHDNSASVSSDLVVDPAIAGLDSTNNYTGGRRAGYAGTSGTGTLVVRATTYTPGSGNATRYVKSTSTSDTSAGVGAQKVKITYFSFASGTVTGPFTTEVTLNGTTEVATSVSDIAFIEKMQVSQVGSNGGNAGTIQLLASAGGAIMGSIAAGDNQTYWAHHYVPSGKSCYITDVMCAAKSIAGVCTMQYKDPTSDALPQGNLDITFAYGTTLQPWVFPVPMKIDGPVLIWLTTKADSNTASTTHAGFGFFEK